MNEVPWLRSGVGSVPGDGGCIMQVIDWIHRREWTDQPPCVHPVIREVAIRVNDLLDDAGRQQLLVLAPRMMGTAGGDGALTRRLLGYLARRSYPFYAEWAEEWGYDEGGAVLACIEAAEKGEAADAADAAAWAARAAVAASRPDYLGLLVGLLDRYDELVPRDTVGEIDWQPVCEIMHDADIYAEAGERVAV